MGHPPSVLVYLSRIGPAWKDNTHLRLIAAQTFNESGQFNKTIALLSAPHEGATSHGVHYELGRALASLGQIDKAVRHFSTAQAKAPNNARYAEELKKYRAVQRAAAKSKQSELLAAYLRALREKKDVETYSAADAYIRVAPVNGIARHKVCNDLKKSRYWAGIVNYVAKLNKSWRQDETIVATYIEALRNISLSQQGVGTAREFLAENESALVRRQLGFALAACGHVDEGIEQLRIAEKQDPDRWEPGTGEVRVLLSAGRSNDAETLLLKKIEDEPADLSHRVACAKFYSRMKNHKAACEQLIVATELEPETLSYTLAFMQAALSLPTDQYVADAIEKGEAFVSQEANSDLISALALLYARAPVMEEDIQRLKELRELLPQDEKILDILANAFFSAGQLSEYRQILEDMHAANPKNSNVSYRLAGAMAQMSESRAAIDFLKIVIPQSRWDAIFKARIGNLLLWSGEIDEAARWLREAIVMDRTHAGPVADLAVCMEQRQDLSTALALSHQALTLMVVNERKLVPGIEEMNLHRLRRRIMFAAHLAGEKNQALRLLKEAQMTSPFVMPYPVNEWMGGPVDGKKIIAVTELGIGDEIRFTSVFTRLLGTADEVSVTCDPRLASLLSRSFPAFRFLPTQRNFPRLKRARDDKRLLSMTRRMSELVSDAAVEAGKDADQWVNVMRLYEFDLFGGDRPIQSPTSPVLIPEKARKAQFRRDLHDKANGRPVIGLSWRGGHRSYSRDRHYFDLTQWLPLLEMDSCFVNLQYNVLDEELELLRRVLGDRLIEFPELDLTNDIEGLAALTSELTAVAAICTSVLELACSVGTRSLYLMRFPQILHRFRLSGEPDQNGTYQDKIWASCRVLPRFKISDEDMISASVAHMKTLL